MEIVSRAEWGARPAESITPVSWAQRREFIVHYSAASKTQTVRSIQNFHMDVRGWSDIGYNFLCDVDGTLYMGRGWDALGTHTVGHNTSGIAVCFIGTDADVTPEAMASIRWLADEADRLKGSRLAHYGHRDLDETSCPGDRLHAWVHAGMPIEEEDMNQQQADQLSAIHWTTTAIPDSDGEGRIPLHVWAERVQSSVAQVVAELAALRDAGTTIALSAEDRAAIVAQLVDELRPQLVAAAFEGAQKAEDE